MAVLIYPVVVLSPKKVELKRSKFFDNAGGFSLS